jgi:thiazole/oxazole-forming peptide maturase SagD family component
MLKNYPSHTNLKNRFGEICGQHAGILESQILFSAKTNYSPSPALCTNSMPAYHKLLIGENVDMSYHLSGYGYYREEAMIRLLGEGIERYALLIAPTLYKNKFVFASYKDIQKQGTVIPWEYIKIFSDEDYEKLEKRTMIRNITQDDTIGWLKCSSIYDPEKEIFVPAQLLFTGYQTNTSVGEQYFAPGFSKGSASHTDFKKALKSAILEYVEADALMINWYTGRKCKKIILDDPTLLNMLSDLLGKQSYELMPFEYSLDELPGHTFGLALVNKKEEHPYIVMGCQTTLEPLSGMYRAVMEALAILYLANYGALVMPKDYLETTVQKSFANLDANVAYWAHAVDMGEKKAKLLGMLQGETALSGLKDYSGDIDLELEYILKKMKSVSEYGVFLDITPPEVKSKGWKCIRTFFPELVQMSLPGFPYSNHPRIKKYGGIKNDTPHPLP